MFKNFKLAQCDNFLIGAYAWFGLAVTAVLYLIIQSIDFNLAVLQGMNWVLNGGMVVVMFISGIMWLEEGMRNVLQLMKDKQARENNERYEELWKQLSSAYSAVGTISAVIAVIFVIIVFISFVLWL